jgi:hypothetical protein
MRVYPLAEVAHPPEMNFVNISGKAFNTIGPFGLLLQGCDKSGHPA